MAIERSTNPLTKYGIEAGRSDVEKLWEATSRFLKERFGQFSDESEIVQDGNKIIFIRCDKSSNSGNARLVSIRTYDLKSDNHPISLIPEAGIEVRWPFNRETSYSLDDSTITPEWIERVITALKKAK